MNILHVFDRIGRMNWAKQKTEDTIDFVWSEIVWTCDVDQIVRKCMANDRIGFMRNSKEKLSHKNKTKERTRFYR